MKTRSAATGRGIPPNLFMVGTIHQIVVSSKRAVHRGVHNRTSLSPALATADRGKTKAATARIGTP